MFVTLKKIWFWILVDVYYIGCKMYSQYCAIEPIPSNNKHIKNNDVQFVVKL